MSNEKPKTSSQIRDDVDRVTDRIRRATGELVQLMGNPSGDSPVDLRAARALIRLGAYAVEPLAAGLRRARGLHHRCAIIVLIKALAPGPIPEVIDILQRVARKDPEDHVRALALDAMSTMATREMVAMVEAGKRRAAEAAASPGPRPLPDGCSPSLARMIREGEVSIAGDRS